MKQLSRILPTYTSDLSGVCSALYELGGMVVMHDASGCNSSYTTFDEPRWYDMDSMIYGSGLDETDAMLGNDERLIGDIVNAAAEMQPRFIAVTGGPVPMMIGTDFTGIAQVVEKRTGIPVFGLFTNGMNFYTYGAGLAFEALARHFLKKDKTVGTRNRAGKTSINIIGATPLDFSVKENVPALKQSFIKHGYTIVSVWAMGSDFEDILSSASADVNVVVSSCGLPAAKYMRDTFGIPYVVGIPVGDGASDELFSLIDEAAEDKENRILRQYSGNMKDISYKKKQTTKIGDNAKVLIIGEQVYANSLRFCLSADYGLDVRTLCPLDPDLSLLIPGDLTCGAEEDIENALADFDIIVADPLYKYVLPPGKKYFVDMPHEAFSGRIYRKESPCIIGKAIYDHIKKFL